MIEHPAYPNGSLYLSGGMQYSKDLGASWRSDCKPILQNLGFYVIDITALDVAYSKKFGHPYLFVESTNLLQYKSNIRRQIVHCDVELVVKQSHAMIVYYDEAARRGAGTQSECQVAYDSDIPYFLLKDPKETWSQVPGWIRANSIRMFDTFDDLYKYLAYLPDGILKPDLYGNRHSGTDYLCALCGNPFEKRGAQFVSKVSPMYCKSCVQIVKTTHEANSDRYEFFLTLMTEDARQEMLKVTNGK